MSTIFSSLVSSYKSLKNGRYGSNYTQNDSTLTTPLVTSSDNYRARTLYDIRRKETHRILQKYPDRVPIILEPATRIQRTRHPLPKGMSNIKFLIPKEFPSTSIYFLLRKKLDIYPEDAIFVYLHDPHNQYREILLNASDKTMGDWYTEFADTDGLLYLSYADLETFGSGFR